VSRREGETYRQYIRRAAAEPMAAILKWHDILDNMREPHLIPSGMIRRYSNALDVLEGAIGEQV